MTTTQSRTDVGALGIKFTTEQPCPICHSQTKECSDRAGEIGWHAERLTAWTAYLATEEGDQPTPEQARIRALYKRTQTAPPPVVHDQTTLFDYTPPAAEKGHSR